MRLKTSIEIRRLETPKDLFLARTKYIRWEPTYF